MSLNEYIFSINWKQIALKINHLFNLFRKMDNKRENKLFLNSKISICDKRYLKSIQYLKSALKHKQNFNYYLLRIECVLGMNSFESLNMALNDVMIIKELKF
jgi:hypothetical protein